MPLRRHGAALAALAALLFAPALHAQDVLQQGRAYGIQPPAWVTETLREQPDAFEFRRAWRNKVKRVRQERRRLEAARTGPVMSASLLQSAGAAVTGTMRVPVIAARYSDRTAPYPVADYQARLFGDGTAGAYTAKSFYREMSRNAFTMDGTVAGWIPLPQTAAYYEPSTATDSRYGRTFEFLRDALTGADPTVNFGQFDNDGPDGVPNSGDDDGYVDAAAFIYPAHGKSCGGPGIWPHRYAYSAYTNGVPFSTNDPSAEGGTIKVDDYLIQGGLECDGTSLMPIGTFAHEMGHALALPDLYDTDGGTEGLGEWDLMGSGNYRLPASPTHMSAWSKDFLGWVNVETVSGARPALTLAPVYDAGRVLRYNIPGTREYFLLEHRKAFGSDTYIRGAGLLVYHIDDAVIDLTLNSNDVNAGTVHGVDLEEADGLDQLDKTPASGGNRGDAGDPFPGTGARTAFGDASYPSSRSNSGAPSGFDIRALQYAGGVLTFDLQAGSPATPVNTVVVSPGTASVSAGTTRQLTAALYDANNVLLTGRAVTWSSSAPSLATVSSTGLVTALAQGGPVTITATSEGKSGQSAVTVTAAVTPGTLITSGVPVTNIGATYPNEVLYRIAVPAGATMLTVTTSGGSGDADLYVRRGTPPTTSVRDCASGSSTNTEQCTLANPASGDWYIMLKAFASFSGVTLTATVSVPAPPLAVGDSATGQVASVGAVATFPLVMTAGDVVDVGAFVTGGQSTFHPYVELYSPAGALVASSTVHRLNRNWILPRYTAAAAGTYSVRVRDRRTSTDLNKYTGSFKLRTRRSGVVIVTEGEIDPRFVPAGSPAVRDTVWVYNVGAPGTATFTATPVKGEPWMTVSVPGGITPEVGSATLLDALAAPERVHARPLPGRLEAGAMGAAPAAPRAAPAGAVPVQAVLTPGSLAQGYYYDDILIQVAGDPWNQGMAALVDLRLHSPAARVMNETVNAYPGTMARGPQGQVVMASGSGLVRIDPVTGAATPWVSSLSSELGGMEFAADGTLYVADYAGKRLLRVRPDATWTVAVTGTSAATDVAVLPTGTVFVSMGSTLVRMPAGGTAAVALTSSRTTFADVMVYNPADGWLYYASGTALRRYNPATNADEARGTIDTGPLLSLDVGRSGRLYGMENQFFGGVLVMETTGTVVGRMWSPGIGYGLALAHGTLYGSSIILTDQVWSMPVDDSPAGGTPGIAGDANGDGTITAQDALGVLSAVVGKSLPAGWNLAIGGDANCDGQVTSIDALIILSRVVSRDVSQFCIGTNR
ncbi:MAG TPA: M6 family metalloprotease domain-containing protein [Longimicrobium sp.]|jgi:M6 family metalloprotease-like protein